jgi:hypothetical protein
MIADKAAAIVYLCRSNFTEKELLHFPKNLIEEGKLKNVGFIINGIGSDAKYGYGYNYGYGYGYSSSQDA